MRFRRRGKPKRIMTYEEMLRDLKRAIEREGKAHRRGRREK